MIPRNLSIVKWENDNLFCVSLIWRKGRFKADVLIYQLNCRKSTFLEIAYVKI